MNKHFEHKRRGLVGGRAEPMLSFTQGCPHLQSSSGTGRRTRRKAVQRTEAGRGWGPRGLGLDAGKQCGPAFLSHFPSCVLRRSWRPAPWEERGPGLLLQVICLLLLPAPSGAGGLPTAVLPVRWDVEWHPAQLHR